MGNSMRVSWLVPSVPLCTRHGAKPLRATELLCRGVLPAVLALQETGFLI